MVLFWKDSINAWEEVPTLFQPKVSTASIKKKKKNVLLACSVSHTSVKPNKHGLTFLFRVSLHLEIPSRPFCSDKYFKPGGQFEWSLQQKLCYAV